ncbi:MAG: arginine repressor [Pyrinomonadaceae bacterium]
MQKYERQDLILDLIASRVIGRQEELAELLDSAGVSVTQASISRDLDELGIVKVDGRYARFELPVAEASPFGVSAVMPAGTNMIVVCCSSGLASAAAVRIDAAKIGEILGTLAGDDTIFIAVNNEHDQKVSIRKLKMIFAAG